MKPSPTEPSGHWVEIERAWHETEIGHCRVCGRLITSREWRFESEAEGEIAVCDPSCEELYVTYWWPTHGKDGSR